MLFRPLLAGATLRDRLIACLGAAIAIAVTFMLSERLAPGVGLPVVVAPVAASAVLVFAVPASPLAQPWPVIGGNVLSTLVGVVTARTLPGVPLAAGVAVGAAILAMSLLRCLHPPGGAAALFAVTGGGAVHAAGFGFALAPVGVNSVLLVLVALLFHRLSGHRYPHRGAVTVPPPPGLHAADIDAALRDMHESFDIDPDDLVTLLTHAERHAQARTSAPEPALPRR